MVRHLPQCGGGGNNSTPGQVGGAREGEHKESGGSSIKLPIWSDHHNKNTEGQTRERRGPEDCH